MTDEGTLSELLAKQLRESMHRNAKLHMRNHKLKEFAAKVAGHDTINQSPEEIAASFKELQNQGRLLLMELKRDGS